jgi:carboxyl-terminal processing protease
LHNKIKSFQTWLLVMVLAAGAFFAGDQLHMRQTPPAQGTRSVSVQANALLKLTPECAPIIVNGQTAPSPSENRELVSSVVRLLKSYYVDQITPEKETAMARGVARGMLDSLSDPDSRFIDPGERKLLDEASSGTFRGIGAIVALKKAMIGTLPVAKVVVITPMPGSPAESAGLKSGDVITYVNDKWVVTHNPFDEPELDKLRRQVRNKEMGLSALQKAVENAAKRYNDGIRIPEALDAITANSTGDVTITVERPGEGKPIQFKIPRRSFAVDPVSSTELKRGVFYVRVSQFNSRAVKEFASELGSMASPDHRIKALVLDLRNNPGGLVDSAASIAGRITGGGVMASIQEKSGRRTIRVPKTSRLKVPVTVLVNEGTASVAELVASDLKESVGAVIVGAKTYGDGLVQTPMILKDGSEAVLTTGKMLTPRGVSFNGTGVQPDRPVGSASIGRHDRDPQLEEAQKILQQKLGK